jgi:hypothetical protein
MAWADLTISEETIRGNVPVTLYDREFRGVDPARITDEMVAAARRKIERRLHASIPQDVIVDAGGMTAFLDLAMDEADLGPLLEDAAFFAAMMRYFPEEGYDADDPGAGWAKEGFEEAMAGFLGGYTRLVDTSDLPLTRRPASHTTDATASYGAGYG